MGETVSCQLSRLVHTAGSFMRSCGQCGGYVLVCGPLREPTMSRVETLPDEPAWHESKEHACGIRAINGKEGVSAERCATMQARRRQAWLLVRKESVRGDRLRTCGAHTKELPACDHGRGKRGLQRERVRKGKQVTKQGASPGLAERARARCLSKCGRQKRLPQKIASSSLRLPSTAGPDFSYCMSSSRG